MKHLKYYGLVNIFIAFTFMFLAFFILVTLPVDAQWRSKTHDKYEAYAVDGGILDIRIDGKFDDWDLGVLEGPRSVVGTNGKPFKGVKNETNAGNEKEFEEHAGGKWNGKKDWMKNGCRRNGSAWTDKNRCRGTRWNDGESQMKNGCRRNGTVVPGPCPAKVRPSLRSKAKTRGEAGASSPTTPSED